MKLRGAVVALTALVVLALAAPAVAGTGLNSYKAKARGAKQLRELKRMGFDLTEGKRRGGIEIVATKSQISDLRKAGISAKLIRDRRGRTARRAAAAQAAGGWAVWRPYARTDVEVSGASGNPTANIKTQLERIAQQNRNIVKLETIGNSLRGQPIYALKVTKDARDVADGSRPAVLYSAVQHAREWLAGETERRTLRMFVDNYGKTGTAVGTDGQPIAGVSAQELTSLVNTRELWFIIIANPDGYDFTFDPPNRLWRKNLRDNNGDGQITGIDGVDPNRNFPTHWNYDNEGSNSNPDSETYRGTAPQSEPETKAFLSLMNRVNFAYNKNDHTAAKLILWPFGWQVDTHPADEPLMTALAGDDANPGIETFDPDVGADLYTTNGDTNDHMYASTKTISFTPEGTQAATGSVFAFQDNEADVQAEFERHVQFALDLARSAPDPTHPVSHLTGFEPPNFVVDKFNVSYGSPQTVQVNARRDLGTIRAHWQVNGGPTQSVNATEWTGGLRYGDDGDYWYHRMRAQVGGNAGPGDSVKVWFTAPNSNVDPSGSFTYNVRSNSGADVLVLAVEDYTGVSAFPAYNQTKKPNYLSYYTNALADNGVSYDVYDFDAMGRKAPDPLGVLSHYDAVVWYTGNDNVTRNTNTPGVADAEAWETIMSVRDFVNEGGRVSVSGVNAGRQWDLVEYPTEGLPNATCDGDLQTTDGGVCNPLSNDFAQYYLGAYLRSDAGGQDAAGNIFPVVGTDGGPFEDLTFELNGASSAKNQGGLGLGTGNFLVTSSVLPKSEYPQFESDQAADWQLSGGAAFDPHSGSKYLYSQNADEGYKRIARTIDLSGVTGTEPANLSFWTSFNTELDWDFVFVEARTAGQDDWTTLPDQNGHTSQNTGASCPAGWGQELHFQLQHYQTRHENGPGDEDNTCDPVGSVGTPVGQWHAASGNSSGWQNWSIDLSAYRGKQVEIAIVFATDWGTTTVPGAMVDDVKVTAGSNVSETSFETDLGGWTIPGAHPAGPSTNVNDWIQSERIPFEDAAVTVTRFGMMFGFGLEGVNGAGNRAVLMDKMLDHLLQ
jgi:Zinc carboxypeptidase/Immune inhibitor A-like, MAM domain